MTDSHKKKQDVHRPATRCFWVIDYGSQYSHLIVRRIRDLGFWAELYDISECEDRLPADLSQCWGVVLSGGPRSVTDTDAWKLPNWFDTLSQPALGICYGMQLLAHALGGQVQSAQSREYGAEKMNLEKDIHDPLFEGTPENQLVWMSHGDHVESLGKNFYKIATSQGGVAAAMKHRQKLVYGLQFHPEADHSEYGIRILENFTTKICGAQKNWDESRRLELCRNEILQCVGPTDKVLVALSGGVDSSVLALLLCQTLGHDRVIPVFVDHGLLREGEREWVSAKLKAAGMHQLVVLREEERFLSALKNVSDPEKKRKIIGKSFIEAFENYAKTLGPEVRFLAQGTLYPDVIESGGHGKGSKVIKSHHNVGGLPEHLKFSLLEPFRFLYKDEVRKIGLTIGLEPEMVGRHPFPGPGLAIRIIGPVTEEHLTVLKQVDRIFIEALKREGLYNSVWQAFAVLLPGVTSVGVMGDNRTFENVCALRAVSARDGMSAAVSELSVSFLSQVASKIVREVKGINRVVYDITTKPPATIEWE